MADNPTKVPPDDIRQRALSFLRVRQAILTPKPNPPATPDSANDTLKNEDRSGSIAEFRKRERENE